MFFRDLAARTMAEQDSAAGVREPVATCQPANHLAEHCAKVGLLLGTIYYPGTAGEGIVLWQPRVVALH